jgi:hypothetical protein
MDGDNIYKTRMFSLLSISKNEDSLERILLLPNIKQGFSPNLVSEKMQSSYYSKQSILLPCNI